MNKDPEGYEIQTSSILYSVYTVYTVVYTVYIIKT